MALNNFKYNRLMPLHFERLNSAHSFTRPLITNRTLLHYDDISNNKPIYSPYWCNNVNNNCLVCLVLCLSLIVTKHCDFYSELFILTTAYVLYFTGH